jgi:hypothetical protein
VGRGNLRRRHAAETIQIERRKSFATVRGKVLLLYIDRD